MFENYLNTDAKFHVIFGVNHTLLKGVN